MQNKTAVRRRRLRCPPFYQVGKRYIFDESYQAVTLLRGMQINTGYAQLLPNGDLILKRKSESNGPSGGAINTVNALVPAHIHDNLYQLIRDGALPAEARKTCDDTYRDALKTWGVPRWRRLLHWKALHWFGWTHT